MGGVGLRKMAKWKKKKKWERLASVIGSISSSRGKEGFLKFITDQKKKGERGVGGRIGKGEGKI